MERRRRRRRRGELDSPDERHHLLHDVFAEGDDNKEFLQEETAALVWVHQQTSGVRQVRPKHSRSAHQSPVCSFSPGGVHRSVQQAVFCSGAA